jgi:hypothetical protein
MSGNINLRNLAVHPRGKMRHRVALNRQYLPILFRCPARRLPGLPLTETGPQPEYVGSISNGGVVNLPMERHEVMSFAREDVGHAGLLAMVVSNSGAVVASSRSGGSMQHSLSPMTAEGER